LVPATGDEVPGSAPHDVSTPDRAAPARHQRTLQDADGGPRSTILSTAQFLRPHGRRSEGETMKRSKLFRTGAVVLVLGLVAAACGGDDDDDGDEPAAGDEADSGDDAADSGDDAADSGDDAADSGDGVIVGLVTKTESNPFFVKMREGAQAKADELGVELRSFAGEFDGDNDAQVRAIEDLIAAGAAGILITPSDTVAIVPTVERAREAGLTVIALDTPLDPIDAADATFATDNFRAGELIGQWAAATVDDPENVKIAMLNIAENQPRVGVLRNQGFLTGFGIDVGDPDQWGDEDDPRIVGQDVTAGSEEGGRTAMENLLAIDPDINVVYTINEPAAAGAKLALDAAGTTALIVSVDGGCPGVNDVADGNIGATSMQFPLLMASLGVEAIATGEIPPNSEGLDFYNTGVELITDAPVDGVESQDTTWGLDNCWG
jgi:fructose transport system substrate-binding protein